MGWGQQQGGPVVGEPRSNVVQLRPGDAAQPPAVLFDRDLEPREDWIKLTRSEAQEELDLLRALRRHAPSPPRIDRVIARLEERLA